MWLLLVRHVGARRARATADVCDEWPERRGSAACRRTRGCRGEGPGGAALSLSPALSRGDAIGGQVVWCRRRAMREPGGAAWALVCGPNSPSGEGASLAVRRTSVGARAWGSEPSLPPASSPRARTGLRAYGSSPRGARGAGAVPDQAALSGAARAGWAPHVARGDVGRADRSATDGCRAVPLVERREMSGSGLGGQHCRRRRRCRMGALLGGGVVCCRWRTTAGSGRGA